jgi:metallo-beta-lactamase family protein
MKLTFHGAAGEVTGSGLLIEADGVRFLVDYGLFQGAMRGPDAAPVKNRAAYTRDLGALDFVLLTHAHLDHCGLLPRFGARGGRAPTIWCTKPTADLVPVMLMDSAHVQSRDSSHPGHRYGERRRQPATEQPLYTAADVDRLATRLMGVPYDAEFKPHPSVTVRLRSAGHIVGAAFAEIAVWARNRRCWSAIAARAASATCWWSSRPTATAITAACPTQRTNWSRSSTMCCTSATAT